MPAESDPLWTAGGLLAWAAKDFTSREIPEARASAELLLCHALGTSRVGLYLQFERPVSVQERDRFRELVIERRRRVPVAYLVGSREFYSIPFEVTQDVLIPRPETEILVDEVLEAAKHYSSPKIADVGTGAGTIAIPLALQCSAASVVAVDISLAALAVAERNAQLHRAPVKFIQSDLLSEISEPLDLIVANLPYVPAAEYGHLAPEIRDHEPRLALDGGPDGLDLVRRLVQDVVQRFPHSKLFLEFGFRQDQAVTGVIQQAGWRMDRIRSDYAGIPRIAIASKGSNVS